MARKLRRRPDRSAWCTPGEDGPRGLLVLAFFFLVLLWRAPELERFLRNAGHGYLLSLGQQTLLGRFPFVDLTYVYGPLIAFSSALGIWLSGNLIGEIVICAFFYGASLTFLHVLARRRVSRAASWVAPIVGLLLLARFHKWFVWFFPLAALYCYHRQLDDDDSSLRWWVVGGLVAGTTALFRLDYGVALFVFFSVLIAAPWLASCPDGRRVLRRWAAVAITFVAPLAMWLVVLGTKGGVAAVQQYFAAFVEGGSGAVTGMPLPFPRFSLADPVSLRSAHAVAIFLMPVSYLLCVAGGAWRGFIWRRDEVSEWRFVGAVGLLGLAVYPHAVSRLDVSHLLQAVTPMLLAAPALLRRLVLEAKRIGGERGPASRAALWVPAAAYGILLASTAPLLQNPPSELAPLGSSPVARYRDYARELEATARSSMMQAQFITEIVRRTNPQERILVIPYASQLYYFCRRPMSGVLNAYIPDMFDDERTRRRNLEHVREHPPSLVVAPAELFQMAPDDRFRHSFPDLYHYLTSHYRIKIKSRGGWILLAAGAGPLSGVEESSTVNPVPGRAAGPVSALGSAR